MLVKHEHTWESPRRFDKAQTAGRDPKSSESGAQGGFLTLP